MVPWREMHKRFPHVTLLPDCERYADVFDAIEEARTRARTWEPSPTDYDVLGTVRVRERGGDEEQLQDFVVVRVPVVPVRTANTVRLCVALLQYDLWRTGLLWAGDACTSNEACLPCVKTLLGRKLRPTAEEGADLARFLSPPGPDASRVNFGEPLAPLLRLLEGAFPPPAPPPLHGPLEEARLRIAVARDAHLARQRSYGGRGTRKRFDQWIARIDQLLGRA